MTFKSSLGHNTNFNVTWPPQKCCCVYRAPSTVSSVNVKSSFILLVWFQGTSVFHFFPFLFSLLLIFLKASSRVHRCLVLFHFVFVGLIESLAAIRCQTSLVSSHMNNELCIDPLGAKEEYTASTRNGSKAFRFFFSFFFGSRGEKGGKDFLPKNL